MNIKLYTDGACSGNPGPGGYGYVLSTILEDGTLYEKQGSQGFRKTTNNRMEIAAVIAGLSRINGRHNVEVVSDSKYVCDAMNKNWVLTWKSNNWYKKGGKVKNIDLWEKLMKLIDKQNTVTFTWVKGHDGHKYNEICDRLAVEAYMHNATSIDNAYENGVNT